MELVLSPWWLIFEAETARPDRDEDVALEEKREKQLACAHCLAPITYEEARVSVNGTHEHSFFNPHGIVFRIGCFSEAEGCKPISGPSSEFTWFQGYDWRIVACYHCENHLGWDFSKSGLTIFYGLILDRLVSAET